MDVILPAYQPVVQVLEKPRPENEAAVRLFTYISRLEEDGAALYYNHLTCELAAIPLVEERTEEICEYLFEHWFLVKQTTDDHKLVQQVRQVLTAIIPFSKAITSYTIFTTMDCNARCFYCFEKGRKRTKMSPETAERTVEYIKEHSGGKKVRLAWFGGEPLFNVPVIDHICARLRESGIRFSSSMASNGFLFDDENVQKAVELWNLQGVQITLDGTEPAYNKTKAYIYRNVNAYQVVKANIRRLLDANIGVKIRLNYDFYNLENLMELVEELAKSFGGNPLFSVYSNPVLELNSDAPGKLERLQKLLGLQKELDDRIRLAGCFKREWLLRKPKLNQCMADSGTGITVLPDGRIGLCEHFSESEFIGSINSENTDSAMIAKWKEKMPEEAACKTCPDYPACVRLSHCPVVTPYPDKIPPSNCWERNTSDHQPWGLAEARFKTVPRDMNAVGCHS